ncbi:hypothetical protein [Mycobacterium sp.]|uniref:hypothetical protein n=1 Tax=Mycobacterium sp. TaxID=1785 RepID=UPI0031DBDE7F
MNIDEINELVDAYNSGKISDKLFLFSIENLYNSLSNTDNLEILHEILMQKINKKFYKDIQDYYNKAFEKLNSKFSVKIENLKDNNSFSTNEKDDVEDFDKYLIQPYNKIDNYIAEGVDYKNASKYFHKFSLQFIDEEVVWKLKPNCTYVPADKLTLELSPRNSGTSALDYFPYIKNGKIVYFAKNKFHYNYANDIYTEIINNNSNTTIIIHFTRNGNGYMYTSRWQYDGINIFPVKYEIL